MWDKMEVVVDEYFFLGDAGFGEGVRFFAIIYDAGDQGADQNNESEGGQVFFEYIFIENGESFDLHGLFLSKINLRIVADIEASAGAAHRGVASDDGMTEGGIVEGTIISDNAVLYDGGVDGDVAADRNVGSDNAIIDFTAFADADGVNDNGVVESGVVGRVAFFVQKGSVRL